MIPPPVWTRERLSNDAARSLAAFEDERLAEVALWTTAFDLHQKEFIRLLHEIGPGDPGKLWPAQVAEIFAKNLGDAFGYLAGPPMSAEELRALTGVSLVPTRLAKDPEAARRVLETIRQRLDDRRFPWVADRRRATSAEQHNAVVASAAMMTAQTIPASNRVLKEAAHEKPVRDFLVTLGYREVEPRQISYIDQAPSPGQFCARCTLGTRKTDVAVRLLDGRLMAIQCEISNNAATGNKLMRKAAKVEAQSEQRFCAGQIIVAVLLAGIFDVEMLYQAQSGPLSIFWSHDLSPLRDFVAAVKA